MKSIFICGLKCFQKCARANSSTSLFTYYLPGFWKNVLLSSLLSSPTSSKCFTSVQFHHILKESVLSTSQKLYIYSRQRRTLRLPSNLQPLSHIQDNWTCCKMSTYTDHLVSSGLLNPHQSAYCKHHSTKTPLLRVYCISKIISSMSSDTINTKWFDRLQNMQVLVSK